MTSPTLKRYIWLTSDQRDRLIIVTASCSKRNSCESLMELLNELQNLSKRKVSLPSVVQVMIRGLRLPKDILPVSICDEAADCIINFTNIDKELAEVIKPKPQRREESQ